jgi:hypothetical protein
LCYVVTSATPTPMPLTKFLQDKAFGPDEIAVMVKAFEDTLHELGLADRTDPATEIVARRIIDLAQQGERDPVRLRDRTIESLSS